MGFMSVSGGGSLAVSIEKLRVVTMAVKRSLFMNVSF
jgi:hypothetical protein